MVMIFESPFEPVTICEKYSGVGIHLDSVIFATSSSLLMFKKMGYCKLF